MWRQFFFKTHLSLNLYNFEHLQRSCVLRKFFYAEVEFPKHLSSTIYALSSGYGKCAVAVIRISGPCTAAILNTMADSDVSQIVPRKAYLKHICKPKTNEILDKGLVLWFPG